MFSLSMVDGLGLVDNPLRETFILRNLIYPCPFSNVTLERESSTKYRKTGRGD